MTSYLCGGTRFKLTPTHNGAAFFNFPAELAGRWVALVDATDNRHMNAPATVPLDAVLALVEKWRAIAATGTFTCGSGEAYREATNECADELEALTRGGK